MKHLFLQFFLLVLWVQSIQAQQFNFQNYSVGEGLAQSQVYSMLEDSRGYIWMGTRGGGLSCFDGQKFKNYTVRDGLVNNYIECLLEDQENNLWIGTQNGLSHYNGLTFTNYKIDSTENITITVLYQDAKGILWLGTNRGVYQYLEGEFFNYSEQHNLTHLNIATLFEDHLQNMWIGTNRGIYKIKNNLVDLINARDGLYNIDVRTITQTKDSTIWIGTFGGGVFKYTNNIKEQLQEEDGLSSNLILDLYPAKDGTIWIGTQNQGISIWNPLDSTYTYLQEKDGLCNNHVRQIQEDTWGNVWIGSSGGGVSKYFGQQFTHYNTNNGLNGNYVYALDEDSLGHLWLSAFTKGVSYYDDTTFTHYGVDSGFLNVKSKAIFEDDSGKVWLGTEGKGLALYDRDTFIYFTVEDGLGGNWIRDITQDSLGQIWIACAGGGINRFVEKIDSIPYQYNITRYGTREGLATLRINALHVDKNNRLWFATKSKGIGYISNGKITNITKKDGLVSNNTRSIVEDTLGHLWVGTAGAGMSRLQMYEDSLQITSFTYQDGLASNNIYLLLFDDDHQLWVGSEIGLDRLELDAEGNSKSIKHFGKSEGFIGIETCQNAALKDQEGNLWFGTINGLTKYNPQNTTQNTIPPKVRITDVQLFYESLSQTEYQNWVSDWTQIKDSLSFPYHQNHLAFEFLGINQPNPTQVRYQWRLKGWREEWSPISERNNITYSNLPPGDYTFQVKAYNEDGIANNEAVELDFTIRTPFWARWWFRLTLMGLSLLLIGGIIRARVNRVRRKAKRAQEQLELENHVLQLEQKALQLQMNPHFIFNALNSIQGLISQQDHRTARYQLAKFSKLMRAILENSRATMISLQQEIDTLEHYLSIELLSRGNNFQYNIQADPILDRESILIPPMMLQPFVENALIHGISRIDRMGLITISFEDQQEILLCKIEDNGVGYRHSSPNDPTHQSTALKVTQERMAVLNKETNVHRLDIQEIILADGKVAGTQVKVYLPIVLEN